MLGSRMLLRAAPFLSSRSFCSVSPSRLPILIVGSGIVGNTLGLCLKAQDVPYDILKTGNESSLELTGYDILHQNALQVYEQLDKEESIQRIGFPLSDLSIQLAPRKPAPKSHLLETIPLDNNPTGGQSFSVSTTKLKNLLADSTSRKKKIDSIKYKNGTSLVTFKGGSSKRYAMVVMADGTLNPYLTDFKKRRPAEFRYEFCSVIIPRNEYDPDTVVELYVFGKRVIVTPISNEELQVTFHEMCEQVPPSPMMRYRNISELVDMYRLQESCEEVGSMQSIIQRIVDLEDRKAVVANNPRFFNVSIPSYHQGKLLMYGCRRQTVDACGVMTSYQIEECWHVAKAIKDQDTTDNIVAQYKQKTERKEKIVTAFCKKMNEAGIYQKVGFYFIKWVRTVISHRLFGRLSSKFHKATAPIQD